MWLARPTNHLLPDASPLEYPARRARYRIVARPRLHLRASALPSHRVRRPPRRPGRDRPAAAVLYRRAGPESKLLGMPELAAPLRPRLAAAGRVRGAARALPGASVHRGQHSRSRRPPPAGLRPGRLRGLARPRLGVGGGTLILSVRLRGGPARDPGGPGRHRRAAAPPRRLRRGHRGPWGQFYLLAALVDSAFEPEAERYADILRRRLAADSSAVPAVQLWFLGQRDWSRDRDGRLGARPPAARPAPGPRQPARLAHGAEPSRPARSSPRAIPRPRSASSRSSRPPPPRPGADLESLGDAGGRPPPSRPPAPGAEPSRRGVPRRRQLRLTRSRDVPYVTSRPVSPCAGRPRLGLGDSRLARLAAERLVRLRRTTGNP